MIRPFRFLIVFAAAVGLAGFVSAQTEQTLHTFTGTDGNSPLASLVMDSGGNLFGTTFVGGAYGAGEVFELQHGSSGWTQSVIYSFTGGADGADPYYADVIFDASGNLYGTTVEGGAHSLGVVFELTPTASGWNESVLYAFSGGKDGASPYAGLLFDTAGNLYGTTYDGGEYNAGTVFELSPAGNGHWTEKVIHTFNVKDGNAPAGGLAHDGSGNLYGVTQGGGALGYGVVYKLSPKGNGWAENILHSFTGGADGGFPNAERLILDSSGSLYGTTQGGGVFQKGAVFRLLQGAGGGWQEQVLYSFEGNMAANPDAGLVSDAAGNLYGTCPNGNGVTSVGAVFELIKESGGKWKGTILHVFTRTDGEFPVGALIRDAAGNLYGTTWLGGADSVGVVFEVGATAAVPSASLAEGK